MGGLPGVEARPHRFGGMEYRLGRREIGHVHGDHLFDIPFTKKIREELVAAGKAHRHHILPESGWASVYLRETPDVDRDRTPAFFVLGLLRGPRRFLVHTPHPM